jgi:predicted N-acyltransferase
MESQLHAKHGGSWSPAQSASVLSAIMRELGSDALVFVGRLDGELCGFSLVLRDGDHWFAHRSGFDYARIGDLPVYFEVGYNSVIEAAASSGARALHHGMGVLRTKELRGFTIVKSFLFIKPTSAR